MVNFITREFSEADTPLASNEWKNKSTEERINLIRKKLMKMKIIKIFKLLNR